MKKDRMWGKPAFAALLVLALGGAVVAAAAGGYGSQSDPLVTLSYLNDTFLGDILEQVDQKIAARNSQIVQQLGGQTVGTGTSTSVTFTVVTLSNGQVLTGDVGCEVMLRVGSATCVSPSTPGLIDETTAGTLNNGGSLVQNHLYMMTIEGRGVQATAATTKLLVRGSYSIA